MSSTTFIQSGETRMASKRSSFIERLLDICIALLPISLTPRRLREWYKQRVLLQMGVLQRCACGCAETHITDAYFANPFAYRTRTLRDKFLPDVPLSPPECALDRSHPSSDRLDQSRYSERILM